MLRDSLKNWLADSLNVEPAKISLHHPENLAHGDYTTNLALILAKERGQEPKNLAEEWMVKLSANKLPAIEKIEIAGPGFLNFFLSTEFLAEELEKDFLIGRPMRESKKINLEFLSANPTGPLTMANGRGGFYGDVLANVLQFVGYQITREYYVNDAGNQVRLLNESIEAAAGRREKKEEYYQGEYVKALVGKSGEEAVEILLSQIKESISHAGISFDEWFSEKRLRAEKRPEQILEFLTERNLLEKKDGAIWLNDAVLVKSDGEYTYFLVDLAYHYNKFFERKFDLAIDVWGADHHGYVKRMKNGMKAIGVEDGRLKIIVMQLVRLVSGGREIKMSKRTGEFVTMDELLAEVGADVTRWFFLERSPDTHVDFNLDLAKEKSDKNPVFYVQYAHARMCSIVEKAKQAKSDGSNLKEILQKEISARNLAAEILKLGELTEDISKDFAVHRLPAYAYNLASTFSAFYRDVLIIEGENYRAGALTLLQKTKETLEQTLSLLGISAPERM